MARRSSSPPAALRKAIAAALVAIVWTSSLLALVHEAAGGHSYCAEHRALEERERERESAPPHAPPSGEISAGAPSPAHDGVDAAPAAERTHEACPFAIALEIDGPPRPARAAGAVLPEAQGLGAIFRRPAPPFAAPLIAAPKTSPPIA